MTGIVGRRADEAGEAEPVLARHHDVEEDEVDRIGRQRLARGRGIFRLGDPNAVARQIGGERVADVALVVDEEDMRFLGHGALLRPGAARPRQR